MSETTSTAKGQRKGGTARRAVFAVLMFAGLLGFLEAAGSIFYYLIVPAPRRQVVEVALGIRDPDLNSVARYRAGCRGAVTRSGT